MQPAPNPTKKLAAVVVVIAAIVMIIVVIFARYQRNSDQTTNQNRVINIVAAENFWGNVASQIGGDHVNVVSIISNPSADPHLYESDAHDAIAISQADIVIENGLGYDDFMDKLLSASPNTNRTILSAAQLLNVSGNDSNPHLWYDISRVSTVANAIEATLVTKDPANKTLYVNNLKTFTNSLQPILDVIDQIKARFPQVPVAYTERVPGYLLADANLKVLTPVSFASAIEDGNDPSPADTAAMESLINNHQIKALLYNIQATSSVTQHIQDLAREANIPVIGVTETMPASEQSYQSWQLHQVQSLLIALED